MTITAKVIADSVSLDGVRLTTLQLRYPKFIHGEFMTHRVFSRNASSSRAIPVERLIRDVLDDPAVPIYWGANQKGMQANKECKGAIQTPVMYANEEWHNIPCSSESAWLKARDVAVMYARAFSDAGYHKQVVNRLLEPFCHINVVVTATEWSNFFALRRHEDAQPEMRVLAENMFVAMMDGAPVKMREGDWHLPYVSQSEWDGFEGHVEAKVKGIKISVARCARVSHLTQDGKTPSIEEDLALYDRLVGSRPLHASPCEHQATPDKWCVIVDGYDWEQPKKHGNLRGWIQYRKTLPGECS